MSQLSSTIQRLQQLINTMPEQLKQLSETDFNRKPAPDKWSKKEILGHLIDSATNNHQRFIRVQFENCPTIDYNQNEWNKLSYYSKLDRKHLIDFWTIYNTHLLYIIKRIPNISLSNECNIGTNQPVTLEWLINEYVSHLDYHLKQVILLRAGMN